MGDAELLFLLKIFSHTTLNKLSGTYKRSYKICLCSIFYNIICGHHLNEIQGETIKSVDLMRKGPKSKVRFFEDSLREILYESFDKGNFIHPYDDELLNKIIALE